MFNWLRHCKQIKEIESLTKESPRCDCATCSFEPDWLPFSMDGMVQIGWCKKDLGIFDYNYFTSQIEPVKIPVLNWSGAFCHLNPRIIIPVRKYSLGETITSCPHWEEQSDQTFCE